MKILYLNNFLEQSGWSTAGRSLIKSLNAVGVDVVPRNISMGQVVFPPDEELKDLMNRDASNPDIIIQHTLPHFYDFNGAVARNIGVYTSETSNFKHSSWPFYINTLDEAWVANGQSKIASIDSGVNVPVHIVPYATDISKFNRSYNPLKFRDEVPEDFFFLGLGEFNRRKNFAGLLKAFHTEFHPEENVQLVIKTTPVGIKGKEVIKQFSNEVKASLRLYPNLDDYKQEIIICDHWSDENIMRLYYSIDSFVSPSYGEAFCYPAIESLGMGKAVIASRSTGFLSYLNNENSWLIDCVEEPTFGLNGGIENMFTGRENWFSPNITLLRKAMREVFENSELRSQKAKIGRLQVFDFSYENIGKTIKKILES